MNNMVLIKSLLILSTMILLGFTAPASADWGMGSGHHLGWGNQMPGWHHGGYEGPGFGYWSDLSEEDNQKLEKERFEFFKATQELRRNMYQKSLELRSELAKETPDNKIAAGLQKEISKFKAEFHQKRLNHFLKMKKISPDIGRGFGGGYGMMGSRGRGGHGMMGRGGYGGGYCPNCPYAGPRGGYGMGPGMMGERGSGNYGMMGSGRGYPQRYGGHMGSLEEKEARKIVENYIDATRNPNLKVGKIVDSGNAFRAQIITQDNSLVEEVLIDKANGSMRPAY
jgi:Spy/CpxP family protein refolding chaperone